jgi:hypothetical protein
MLIHHPERREGTDRRSTSRHTQRLLVTVIVGAYLVLFAGMLLAITQARTAGQRATGADRDARAALAALYRERLLSCEADELDRARERRIGELYPDAQLPRVPPPRDCQQEAESVTRSIAELFRLATRA